MNIWYEVPYILTFIAYFESKMLNTINLNYLSDKFDEPKKPGLFRKDELNKLLFKLLGTFKNYIFL